MSALGALVLLKGYTDKQKTKLEVCRELLAFISCARTRIGDFLEPISDLANCAELPLLEKYGFLSLIREKNSLSDAFLFLASQVSFSENEKALLSRAFSAVGESYADGGVRALDKLSEDFGKLVDDMQNQVPKNIRVASTLAATAILGLVILLL